MNFTSILSSELFASRDHVALLRKMLSRTATPVDGPWFSCEYEIILMLVADTSHISASNYIRLER